LTTTPMAVGMGWC